MEPSQIFGGAEECQSSESGWTMYIGSPVDDDGQSDDGDNDNRDDEGTTHQADPEDESDDSMASDASSGPSHYGNNPWGNGKGGYGWAEQVGEVEEERDENKYCLDKKANKTLGKQVEGKKVEKKEMIFMDGKGKSPVQGGGKVRKNYWVGKRK